jgi:predicted permease
MVCEGALLAGLGGVAALLACPWMSVALQRLILPEIKAAVVPLDLRTLGLVAVLVATAALLSGAAPALWASRRNLIFSIRGTGPERFLGGFRLDVALAAVQVALTLALLVGAGEFARSLYNVLHLELGIDTDRILLVTLDLESAGYSPTRVDEILHRAAERLRLLSGVSHLSLAATIPFATRREEVLIVPGVERVPETESGGPSINAITESFFATTGTRLLKGRPFTSQDRKGTALVTIVNQTMARRLWPGQADLGQCLKIGGDASPCSTVVGVVQDARRSDIQESPAMQYYIPLSQAPASLASRALFVRAATDPSSLIGPVRREVLAVAPDLPFVEVQPLSDLVAPQMRPWRMGTAILSVFGLSALALAAVGLYGVVAHALARRRYEMGVRMALGARWRSVIWIALRHGLTIGGLGALTGLALALGAARYFQPLLFHVSAKDPLVLACAVLLVLALSLLASYIPSRRLRRLDLSKTLRVE